LVMDSTVIDGPPDFNCTTSPISISASPKYHYHYTTKQWRVPAL
jgi:hypothetical protein